MWRFAVFLLIAVTAVLGPRPAYAAPEPPPRLVVGTHSAPPFVIKNDDGSWSGISVDLWRRMAERAGIAYEIREYPVADLLKPDPAIDVVVSLNVSPTAERAMDLTHAFYSTGLAIAVVPGESGPLTMLKQVFTKGFLGTIGLTVFVLSVFGILMWLAERKKNEAQFGGGYLGGVGNGFWWSAVTMTTVGYGDKYPVTFFGRAIALLWMFGGVFAISMFTASISSSLTVGQLESSVHGPADLAKVRVGTVEPSGGARYLKDRSLAFSPFANATEALRALERREVDAVVYEAPLLQYLLRDDFQRVTVLPGTFADHGYAFALRAGSPLRERLNLALLDIVASDSWGKLLAQYIGRA